MILWIDGPYGVGKSTLAEAIQQKLPGSFRFDAELVGNAVRENVPAEVYYSETFEGYDLWFDTCVRLLTDLSHRFDGLILVPMTLMEPGSFARFRVALEEQGVPVRRLLLEADRETVRRRILQRGEDEDCWCMRHIDQCLAAQETAEAALRLSTDGRDPEALAAEVAAWIQEQRGDRTCF